MLMVVNYLVGLICTIHLSHVVGGNVFLGFISAVAFATILVVVSGLTLVGASSISHDIYAIVVKKVWLLKLMKLKFQKFSYHNWNCWSYLRYCF